MYQDARLKCELLTLTVGSNLCVLQDGGGRGIAGSTN